MAEYDTYNCYNRFENLDSLEWKIINHLIYSQSKHSQIIWKILKYSTMDCLLKDNVSTADRIALVDTEDGMETNKRIFLSPYVDDAWTEQCAHLHVYVDSIYPQSHETAVVNLGIETIVHSKITRIAGDVDAKEINPNATEPNPNDSDTANNPVVIYKNRETVLLKSMLAELNGLYLDGIGYLQFNMRLIKNNASEQTLFNGRTYIGHKTKVAMQISGVSEDSSFGY